MENKASAKKTCPASIECNGSPDTHSQLQSLQYFAMVVLHCTTATCFLISVPRRKKDSLSGRSTDFTWVPHRSPVKAGSFANQFPARHRCQQKKVSRGSALVAGQRWRCIVIVDPLYYTVTQTRAMENLDVQQEGLEFGAKKWGKLQ